MLPGLIDLHVLRSWFRAFVLAIGTTYGLLVMAALYDQLDDVIGLGAGSRETLSYFATFAPSLLPSVIPVSLLVSILLGLGQLHRGSEITAMRAAGLSLARITRSLVVVGLVATAALFVLQSRVVPWSVESSRAQLDALAREREAAEKGEDEVGVVRSLAYSNARDGRMWFFNQFQLTTHTGRGVTVSELDAAGAEIRRWAATEAFHTPGKGWSLRDGRMTEYDPATGEALRSLPVPRLDRPDWTEDPDLMLILSKPARDLSWNEVREVLARVSPEDDPRARGFEVQYHRGLATPWTALVVVVLAIPLAAGGPRTNPVVGASKAVGLFFAYYLLNLVCFRLGEQGKLPSLAAAWIPVATGTALAFAALLRGR